MIHYRFHKFILAVVMAGAALVAGANIPAGYYNSLEGKSGQALKDAIQELALQHTILSYNSLWGYFTETDCRPEDPSQVWDMYSDDIFYFRGSRAPYGMNREHSLPKSWWYGYNETQGFAAYTDLNHLYPSEEDANLAKNYWPLGEVSTGPKFINTIMTDMTQPNPHVISITSAGTLRIIRLPPKRPTIKKASAPVSTSEAVRSSIQPIPVT